MTHGEMITSLTLTMKDMLSAKLDREHADALKTNALIMTKRERMTALAGDLPEYEGEVTVILPVEARIEVTDVRGNVSYIDGPFASRKQVARIISYLPSNETGRVVK